MRKRLLFVAGLGIGYVLGARAGRERYEQLVRVVRRVKENPTVQETAGVLEARACMLMNNTKEMVSQKAGHTRLGAKLGNMLGDHSGDSHGRQKKMS